MLNLSANYAVEWLMVRNQHGVTFDSILYSPNRSAAMWRWGGFYIHEQKDFEGTCKSTGVMDDFGNFIPLSIKFA